MNRRNLKLAGLLCLSIAAQSVVSSPIYASAATNITQQQSKVSGTISDGNEPIVGASVIVKGDKSKGTITDLDGNFSLDVAPGTTLVISYIGYKTVEVKAAAGMKITLQEDNTSLSEVVVTALGIKRDRKALGYGLSEVKGEELTKAKETNVVNSLAGKVAGLVVQNTAGGASGSTRVLLRGNTELTGNNQPLYVVDGVPLDNTNFGSAGQSGGYDLGDGISAINPDDIETMTVLKGPAASALYGSRASHGVILITTKKAAKDNVSVEYNGSFTIDTQLAKWDNIQQVYGMGNNGQYLETASSGTNMSWGPKADNYLVGYTDGVKRPFMMYPNNTSNFFRTGLTAQNTAVLGVSSGKTGMRFSVTDMRNKDILPHTNMSRDNFNLRVNTSAGPVDFDFTANYTREVVKNRPALGDSQSNVGKNLMTLAGTIDQSWLRNYENADGSYATWTGTSQYNKNPYWDLYKNDNNSTKDVFRFTGKAIWNIMDGLKLQGTIGTDINNMNFSEYIAKDTPGTKAGRLNNQIFNNRTLNAELLLLYNHSWENFDLNATLGGNYYRVDNKTTNNYGLGELIDNLPSIMNYGEQTVTENTYKKQINSLYASASVGYKHTYYLEGTLRGDKSSTLPVNNNTYVYPSVSGSIVFSEFIKNKKIINYGKVRASWAQVGSDTDPYQLALTYQNGMYKYPGYTIGMITNTTQPNKDLKPTMTSSYELGLEMKFFNNRLGLDVTYYNQNSRDQIISLASSSASSYERRLINAGEIQNKGIEHILPARITADEYDEAQIFMDGDQRKEWQASYVEDGENYTIRDLGKEEWKKLDKDLLTPVVMAYQLGHMSEEAFRDMVKKQAESASGAAGQTDAMTGANGQADAADAMAAAESQIDSMSAEELAKAFHLDVHIFEAKDENGRKATYVDVRPAIRQMIESGQMTDDQISGMREEISSAISKTGEQTMKAMAIRYAADADQKAGVDVNSQQKHYLWISGGKMMLIALLMGLAA